MPKLALHWLLPAALMLVACFDLCLGELQGDRSIGAGSSMWRRRRGSQVYSTAASLRKPAHPHPVAGRHACRPGSRRRGRRRRSSRGAAAAGSLRGGTGRAARARLPGRVYGPAGASQYHPHQLRLLHVRAARRALGAEGSGPVPSAPAAAIAQHTAARWWAAAPRLPVLSRGEGPDAWPNTNCASSQLHQYQLRPGRPPWAMPQVWECQCAAATPGVDYRAGSNHQWLPAQHTPGVELLSAQHSPVWGCYVSCCHPGEVAVSTNSEGPALLQVRVLLHCFPGSPLGHVPHSNGHACSWC